MSGEPSAIASAPPAPTPRTPRTGTALTRPPLSPRGTQKRTPASVLAETPVNTTPPRKVAPLVVTASLISPADDGEQVDRSPMPRRPPSAAATGATETTAAPHKGAPAAKKDATVTAANTAAPATSATTAAVPTGGVKPRTSNAEVVSELCRPSSGRRRSGSNESEPSPSASVPTPTLTVDPKPQPQRVTPRVPTIAKTTTTPAAALTACTTRETEPAPENAPATPRSGGATTKATAPTSPTPKTTGATPLNTQRTAARAAKEAGSTSTTSTPTPLAASTSAPTAAVDRRVGIQLKLEESSEERRRARIVYDELQEYVQTRKDFRESALALLAQSGKSTDAATKRFLKREAAEGLAPIDLDRLVEALGPAPGGTSRGTSRATTPRNTSTRTAARTAASPTVTTGPPKSPITPARTRPMTTAGGAATAAVPVAESGVASKASITTAPTKTPRTPRTTEVGLAVETAPITSPAASPPSSVPLPSGVAATATTAPHTNASTPTPTPRSLGALPPLTPRVAGTTTPPPAETPTATRDLSSRPTTTDKNNAASANTPRERSVASILSPPRALSVAGSGEVDAAAQRELKTLRRDKERLESDVTRSNAKLAELQQKLAQEKDAHSTARREATKKLNEATNAAKQLQTDLRDAQRREERLQKDLQKSAETVETCKQQIQALKEKPSMANSGVLTSGAMTPRAMSVSTTSLGNSNAASAAEVRALERKVESLEKDKKRLEEGLEKMTQRQTDTAAELRATKQELHKLTTESSKEKASLQAELKSRCCEAEKLERVVQQKTEEMAKLKEKAAAGDGVTPTRAAPSASPSRPGAATAAADESTAEQADRINTLEVDLHKAQRELRRANDRIKQLEEINAAISAKKDRETLSHANQEKLEARLSATEQAARDKAAAYERELATLREKVASVEKERDALYGVAQDAADEATKLAEQLEVKENALSQAHQDQVKQREISLVDAEREVSQWKATHRAQQKKIEALEEAIVELQRRAEQVEQEAKTLQAALEAAEQDREELANRYASQSRRLLSQQSQKQKSEANEAVLTALKASETACRQAEDALAAKTAEAAMLAQELDILRTSKAPLGEADVVDSLTQRAKKAESALKAAQRENMEIKAVNDKVFLHLSKLEEQVVEVAAASTRASSGSPGRHSTASVSETARGQEDAMQRLSEHTRELVQAQLAQEKSSRRQLEKELRRLQAKLCRVEKSEAVSPALSPNVSVLVPMEAAESGTEANGQHTSLTTTTPLRRDRHKEVLTSELAQQWNRGYFTPLGSLSPAKTLSSEQEHAQRREKDDTKGVGDVKGDKADAGEATSTTAPASSRQERSSTWRPSPAFEEDEEAELQRQFSAETNARHNLNTNSNRNSQSAQGPLDRGTPISASGQSFSTATLTSLASGAGAAAQGRRRPSRARSPQAAHCLDTRFFDPTCRDGMSLPCPQRDEGAVVMDGAALLHLPAAPHGMDNGCTTPRGQRSDMPSAVFGAGRAVSPSLSLAAAVALPVRYATRLSPSGLVFTSTAQRLLVSGHGRRVERLLLQPTMSGAHSPPHKGPDSASIVSTSAIGSMSHSLYAARMDAEGQHWERNVFAFTVRIGDLRTVPLGSGDTSAAVDPLDILVGFSDRYVPLEGFGNGRNSLRYSGCYYLHLGSGTLYAPAQGSRNAPYHGWAKAATQARAVCSPPSPCLSASAAAVTSGLSTSSPAGKRNVYGVPLAAQPGDEVTCVLHAREQCIHFEWNGTDCGVAFENVAVNPSLYPSVEMNSSGGCVELL